MKLIGAILAVMVFLPNARAAALPAVLGLRLAKLKENLTVAHGSHSTPTSNGSMHGKCMAIEDLLVNSEDDTKSPAVAVTTETPMTIELCYSFCRERASLYFGIQGGKMCVCFDEYTPTGNSATCDAPCEGNSSQVCGGMAPSAYSVEIYHAWVKGLKPRQCNAPSVQNAAKTCTEGGDGKGRNCEVQCAPGYRLGSNTLICDTVRGEWVGTATCVPVTCSAPPRVVNAARVCTHSSAAKNGGKCDVVCLPGFELTENSLTCTKAADDRVKTGVYNGQAYCKAKSCGVPEPRLLASSVTHEVLYPSIITYTCKSGATLDGTPGGLHSYQVQCQESGTFSATDKQCQPMPCGDPPVVKDATRTGGSDSDASFRGTWLYPMVAEYECAKGHSTDGTGTGPSSFRVACMATGQFSEPAKCMPISCGPALALKNSEAQVIDKAKARYYADRVGYQCDKGYALEKADITNNAFEATCEEDAIFSGVRLCTAVSCGTPPVIEHASGPLSEFFYPSTVEYNCEEGYSVGGNVTSPSSFTIECKENGKFGLSQRCEPIRCAAPPIFEHTILTSGAAVGEVVVYPSVLEYKCEDGYSTDRSESSGAQIWTMQCLPNGHFSSPGSCLNIDDCAGHTCGPFGTCVDHIKNYTCDCSSGFEAKFDEDGELLCGNINDCGPMACGTGGQCKDLVNDYTCDCDEGYELTMMGTDKVCARVECGAPPQVQHSSAPNMKASFGDIVDYVCDTGYTTDGTVEGNSGFSIECLASRSFTPTQTCKPVACGYPAATDHSEVEINKSVSFPDKVTYNCDTGYTTDGTSYGNVSFTTACTATGKFSSRLQCIPVSCGPPAGIAHASVDPINRALTFREKASYVCDEGYSTREEDPGKHMFGATCMENGLYSGLETCEAVSCELGALAVSNNSDDEGAEQRVVHFLDEVRVPCALGHTTTGEVSGETTFVGTCTADGKVVFDGFTIEEVKCKKVKCNGELPAVPHARADAPSDTPVFGDTVQFTCDSGYAVNQVLSHAQMITAGGQEHPQKTFSIQCLPTGEFSQGFHCANIDDCVGHTCGPHGTCTDGLNDYSCDCQEGFEQTTLANGEKYCGNVDDCGTHACGEHGVCIDLVSDYTCECEAGYIIENVTVTNTTVTNTTDKICKPVKCPGVTVLANSQMNEDAMLKYPDSITIACLEGYSIDATISASSQIFTVECQVDGSLTPVSECHPIHCGLAPGMINTVAAPDASQEFVFGEEAKYTCAEGYTLNGRSDGKSELILKCGADGQFPPMEKTCIPVTCGAPPPIENAAATATRVDFGSAAFYECNVGYALDATNPVTNTITRACLASGVFETIGQQGSQVNCVRVTCGVPPTATGAQHNFGESEGFFEDAIRYECDDGYSVDGTSTGAKEWSITCMESGLFSPSLATACQAIKFKVTGKVTDATNLAPVTGAQVELTDGTRVIATKLTDASGHFEAEGVPIGLVHIKSTKNQFVASDKDVIVEKNIMSGESADLQMSPVLPPDGWRVVLTWSEKPLDLDAHFYYGPGQGCHVYYGAKNVHCNGIHTSLDVDDRDGYGPETMTLTGVSTACHHLSTCKLYFKVHNWSGHPDLDTSKAIAVVYNGDRKLAEFKIADNDGIVSGRWWSTFEIDGKAGTVRACPDFACVS